MDKKKKLNINDLTKVSGGVIEFKINEENNRTYVIVRKDDTNDLVFFAPLLGKDAERLTAPSDLEVMEFAKAFNEIHNPHSALRP